MPQPLPFTEIDWRGRDASFGEKVQRDLVKNGYDFIAMDARDHFGADDDVALYVQLWNSNDQVLEGEPFVITFGTTPSRTKLVEKIRSVTWPEEGEPDTVGPLHIVRVPAQDSTKSPFMRICNSDDPVRQDDIPF